MVDSVKGPADYLDLGNYNARCFQCGGKYKASQLLKHWQGYYVCQPCYEPRQPQDFVRALPDYQTPPWVQPTPAYTYATFCTANGQSAVPGQMEPGCIIPGYLSPAYDTEET